MKIIKNKAEIRKKKITICWDVGNKDLEMRQRKAVDGATWRDRRQDGEGGGLVNWVSGHSLAI